MAVTQRNAPAVVPPQNAAWNKRIAARAVVFLGRLLMASWRTSLVDEAGILREGSQPLIFCCWHNRLALSMVAYQRYAAKHRTAKTLVAMISASRDGGFLSEVLKRFEVLAVRGSSSRRGQQAFLEASRWIEKGHDVAITPDGPRGPRYVAKEGAVSLSQITGVPIVPVEIRIHGKARLRSWDAFQIPLPFARCHLRFCEPIYVDRNTSGEQREEIRKTIEQKLGATD